MRIVYKRSLVFIALLLLICAGFGVAYLFYDHVLGDDTKVVVDNELSINYINGNRITSNGVFHFSVTNNGLNDVYYNININELSHYDNRVTYTIESTESNLKVQDKMIDEVTDTLLNSVLIKAGATENFTLIIKNNVMTSFTLEIKKTDDIEEYFYSTILSHNPVRNHSLTKVGKDIASENEGLIEDVDDYGMTYYFRGNVTNNYVKFANQMWRIVRINGDGTVKLILNSISNDLSSFNRENENYEDYSKLTITNSLLGYYEENLREYDTYLADYKFCTEVGKTEENKEFIYNAYTRIATNEIPTFNCLGKTVTQKVGLITADEVIYAGATLSKENKNYYLYQSDINNYWWTSTLAKSKASDYYPFSVNTSGKVLSSVSGMLNRGLRPVIVLNRNISVQGDGTIDNPYMIENR